LPKGDGPQEEATVVRAAYKPLDTGAQRRKRPKKWSKEPKGDQHEGGGHTIMIPATPPKKIGRNVKPSSPAFNPWPLMNITG